MLSFLAFFVHLVLVASLAWIQIIRKTFISHLAFDLFWRHEFVMINLMLPEMSFFIISLERFFSLRPSLRESLSLLIFNFACKCPVLVLVMTYPASFRRMKSVVSLFCALMHRINAVFLLFPPPHIFRNVQIRIEFLSRWCRRWRS